MKRNNLESIFLFLTKPNLIRTTRVECLRNNSGDANKQIALCIEIRAGNLRPLAECTEEICQQAICTCCSEIATVVRQRSLRSGRMLNKQQKRCNLIHLGQFESICLLANTISLKRIFNISKTSFICVIVLINDTMKFSIN